MDQALSLRKNSRISKGTHYRILAQARSNLKASLLTVAVAAQIGVVNPEDVDKLMATMKLIPSDVDEEKLPEVLALVRAVVDRIVML